MLTTRRLTLGLGLLLAVVALAQESKAPTGYKGVHWAVIPKSMVKDGKTVNLTDKDGKSLGLTTVEFRFDKAVPYEKGGCATTERSFWGNILKCTITLPDNVAGGIVQLGFRCDPPDSGPCKHTVECPSGATCIEANQTYVYATTPANLDINKPRTLDWHGWTNDGNHATLIFYAFVQ